MTEEAFPETIENRMLPALPNHWRWVKFSDLCERVSVGHVGPTTRYFSDKDSGIALVRSQNVRPGRLNLDEIVYITQEFHGKLKKSQLRAGDVLIVRVGANRSDCCVVPKNIPELNCANIVFARPKSNGNFYSYYFQTHFGRKMLLGATTGAAQEVINTASVANMPVPFAPKNERDKISNVIDLYGDLIQNNRRRIQLLEEFARLLYKEWFVQLRFPGHKHVKIVDGVPEGWGIRPLTEISVVNETSLKKGFDGEIEYIDIASVSPNAISGTTWYEFHDAPGRARRVLQHKDIIWSCVRPNRRSHALVWMPHDRLIASTGFAVISPKKISPCYLYQYLTTNNYVGYLTNNAGGAAYPAVTAKVFEKSDVLVPTENLQVEYEGFSEDIYQEIQLLGEQNKKLAQARDILLPRLMNGTLAV